jgi:hypothetical protein
MFQRGDFVELDGLLAVVVGTDADGRAPEDHVALWFGDPRGERVSKGGAGGLRPEVWTVPSEYCSAAPEAIVKH